MANSDAVLRFPYATGDTRITVPGTKLVELPAGAINHHWTKNLIASANGSKLYVTVGSNSNVAERGILGPGRRSVRRLQHPERHPALPLSAQLDRRRSAGKLRRERGRTPCGRAAPGGQGLDREPVMLRGGPDLQPAPRS